MASSPTPWRHRAAVTLVALLGTGTLAVLPATPATAAPDQVAESPASVRLVDLGVIGDGSTPEGLLTAINNRGDAVGMFHEDGVGYRAAVFNRAERRPVDSLFPEADYVQPEAIADNGDIVGLMNGVGDDHAFRLHDGSVLDLGPGLAHDVTENGDVLTDGAVVRPDGSRLRLSSDVDYAEPSAMNEGGAVVGLVDVTTGPGAEYHAFRTVPGEPIDLTRDLLPWAGAAGAADLNDAGIVVGHGRGEGGGHVPLVWDADGNVRQPQNLFGGEIKAVNEAGTGVGILRDGSGARRAGIFPLGEEAQFLQEVLPEESPWVLDSAADINDQNVVVGQMHPADAPNETHGFLLDLADSRTPEIVAVSAEERDYPSGDWKPITAASTTDGNAVRLTATVHNPSPYPASATVVFQDEYGDPVEGGRFTEILMGHETLTEYVEVDTVGLAWDEDGAAHPDAYAYRVLLSQAGTSLEADTIDVTVDPRPVVLVHGYKSDARASWDAFKNILPTGHPGLEGYAVGDGQYPGRMRTGDLAHPFTATNTIAENASQEATYIEALREDLDAWHVDIVAHSMGGLISRVYLQEMMPAAPSDGRPVVNRLIQVGTPNMGSPCADELLNLSVIGATPLMPATLQLSQSYLNDYFNIAVRVRRGVPISNLSGQGQVVPCGIPTAVGDLVVPDYSSTWTLTDVVLSDVNHLEMTEDQGVYVDYILPRLRTVASPESARSGASASQTSQAANAFDALTVDVAASATRTVSLEPGDDATAVGVTMSPHPDLTVTLIEPDGTVADEVVAGSPRSRLPVVALSAPTTDDGAWTLRVHNTGASEASVPVVASLDGSATSVSVEATPAETGRVAVNATVASPSGGDTTVTASFIDVTGECTTVDLVDDGEHGDGEAGDGVFGGESIVLPDGPAAVAVDADTPAGRRIAGAAVEIAQVDRSPRTLTLTAQPGGTASADPTGPTLPYGSSVTVTASPHEGETSLGWRVDGKAVPAGPLELTMDRDHDVVALFGHYTVTEIPAPPGGRAENSVAAALNDRGEVAVTTAVGSQVGPTAGRQRAAIFSDGQLRVLPGLDCTPGPGEVCEQVANGIDERGNVVGSARVAVAGQGSMEHATVWRAGVPSDLHPAGTAYSVARSTGANGQVFGWARPDSTTYAAGVWTNGSFRRFANAALDGRTVPGGRMNAKGQVALDWLTHDAWGRVVRSQAALLTGRTGAKLPTYEGCPPDHPEDRISSGSSGINAAGTVVGWALCDNTGQPKQAMVWQDGEATSLGDGVATDVNDGGLVAGSRWTGSRWVPTLWNAEEHTDLETLMPAACPPGGTPATPCVELETLVDVNNAGQVIATGYVRDRSPQTGEWERSARSFLLSPSRADADLVVQQSPSTAEIAPGARITRTARVTNDGPDTATGVVVDLALPAALQVAGCTSDVGDCVAAGTGRRVVVPELRSGATVRLTVTATVPPTLPRGAVLTTTASAVSRAVRDRVPGNDVVAATSTVKPVIDEGILFADPVPLNTDSTALSLPLTNRTEAPLTVRSVQVSNGFRTTAACTGVLAPGQSCPVTIVFRPTEARDYTGVATIDTAELGAITFSLSGTGKAVNGKPVIVPQAPQVGTVNEPFTLRVPFTDPDPTDSHTAQIVWPNSGGPVPVDRIEEQNGSGVIVATRTFSSTVARDTAILILKDSADNTALQPIAFSITDRPANTAPVVTVGADAVVDAGTELIRVGSFTDTGSSSWTATVDYGSGPQALALDGHGFTLTHVFDEPGTFPVTVRVRDEQGLSGTAAFMVRALRVNHDPVLTVASSGTADEGRRWMLAGTVTDPDTGDRPTLSVDYGDGSVEAITPGADGAFALAHQWDDDGVQRVTVTAADGSGGTATEQVAVTVSNVAPVARILAPAADQLVLTGTPVDLSGSFEDLGVADLHTATWSTGSASVTGKITEAGGRGSVAARAVFDQPGTYRLALTVTDDDGATHRVDEVGGKPVVVTVVRQDSLVAVLGAVDTPRGSCTLVPGCGSAGNAPLAVGAMFWPGRTTPVGAVTLTTSHFKLVGTSLETLVTSGGRGTVTGTGVVNGTVGVRFTVDLVGESGRTPGRARLRVWRQADGALVFDNARSGIEGTAGRVNGEVFVH